MEFGSIDREIYVEASPEIAFEVIDVQAPRFFSFRWTQPSGEAAVEGNSLLVTFELSPSGSGTLVKFAETGFREMGWEVAVLEETYNEHVNGWNLYIPRLAPYVLSMQSQS
ncbi:MAG: SRPBCC domain-containing protein [Actinomycetota bacterium]|nr:SRPBCC domain-containing protein [Actinomycetota bacterium]